MTRGSAYGLSLEPAHAWLLKAACHADGIHPDTMFPDTDAAIAHAKRICARCPVWGDCLDDALRTGDNQHGIRGGYQARERRALAKQHGAGRAIPVRPPRPGEPRAATLAEALNRRLTDTGDGHQTISTRHVYFDGRPYTATRAAFIVGHGRDPEGIIRRTCGNAACVRAGHLADAVIRDSAGSCGTRSAYLRHRARGEDCEKCRRANTAADNRLRRTGTTRKAAA